jgi:tetratricopeptide (TPR) repeat protein
MSGIPETELTAEFQNARRITGAALNEQGLSAEHKGNMHQNLAFCLQAESLFEDALHDYRRALQFREEAERSKEPLERRGTAMTLARIAECLMELCDYDEATQQASRALAIFQHIGDVNRTKQVEATLQQIAERR